ncbi:unnamed protein product [Moneuplotes crassus]|uniref:Uncharacterized protein n=1 Tax=Euplotes crassus TaxID=5936 RepID=A0AAD1X688_EUPCR|nr:unnamed protein product [Moneuplotes crassus]
MSKFEDLTCELSHCKRKVKHFVPCVGKYVCGCCKKQKYFKRESFRLTDPEEIVKSLEYVEINIQAIKNTCVGQESAITGAWRDFKDFLESFEQRAVQGRATLKELLHNKNWPELSQLELQTDAIVEELNESQIFRDFIHYQHAENIRLSSNEVLADNVAMQENYKLRRDLEKLVREKAATERNYRGQIAELLNSKEEIARQREQFANDLEAAQQRLVELEAVQARVQELEERNTELDRDLVRHQTEREEHLTQIKDLKSNYDELVQNIKAEITSMKQPQVQSSHKAQSPCASPSDPKEESKTPDVFKRAAVPTSIVLDMSKGSDKKRLEGMDKSELENMESIEISNLDKIEEANKPTQPSLTNPSTDSFSTFAAKIPRGLKSLSLQFTLLKQISIIGIIYPFPHLVSILSLSSKITERLCIHCNGMNRSDKSQIDSAFRGIKVEYEGMKVGEF